MHLSIHPVMFSVCVLIWLKNNKKSCQFDIYQIIVYFFVYFFLKNSSVHLFIICVGLKKTPNLSLMSYYNFQTQPLGRWDIIYITAVVELALKIQYVFYSVVEVVKGENQQESRCRIAGVCTGFAPFPSPTSDCSPCSLHARVTWLQRTVDRYLMSYSQSTAKGHIRAKQNVFLPQIQIPIQCFIHIPPLRIGGIWRKWSWMSREGRN